MVLDFHIGSIELLIETDSSRRLGWSTVPTFAMARRVVCRINSRAFFGSSLCEKPDTTKQYPLLILDISEQF